MPAIATALKLPLKLESSLFVGRHDRMHITDATGAHIAFCDYTTGPDPEGISGEGAHLQRLPTAAGFAAWDALCDALDLTSRDPGGYVGEVEMRGVDGVTRILDALRQLAMLSTPMGIVN